MEGTEARLPDAIDNHALRGLGVVPESYVLVSTGECCILGEVVLPLPAYSMTGAIES